MSTGNPCALEIGNKHEAEKITITNNLFYANFGGAILALSKTTPPMVIKNNNFVGNGLLHQLAAPDAVAMVVEAGGKKQPIDVETIEEVDFVELNLLGVVAGQQDRRRGVLGVYVQRVLPGSPAHSAGVIRGDRIIAIDGGVVKDIAQVRERIEARAKERVEVLLIRADRVLSYPVAFPRPKEPKAPEAQTPAPKGDPKTPPEPQRK